MVGAATPMCEVGLELALDDLDIRELIMYVWWCFKEEDMGYIHA